MDGQCTCGTSLPQHYPRLWAHDGNGCEGVTAAHNGNDGTQRHNDRPTAWDRGRAAAMPAQRRKRQQAHAARVPFRCATTGLAAMAVGARSPTIPHPTETAQQKTTAAAGGLRHCRRHRRRESDGSGGTVMAARAFCSGRHASAGTSTIGEVFSAHFVTAAGAAHLGQGDSFFFKNYTLGLAYTQRQVW